jgi:hypothetical protein
MRAFYIDLDEKIERSYYIKIENINVSTELKRYQRIEAFSPSELLNKSLIHYNFINASPSIRFELWSNTIYNKGERLDILDRIPKEYEFIWLRAVKVDNK